MKLERLKKLAGLTEAVQVEDPDEEDRRDDDRRAREQKITTAIMMAFKRIGLAIAERDDMQPHIIYFEDDREAMVMLEESEVDLDVLMKLKQTGLSNKFEIHAGANHELRIEFVVSPALDNAVLPRA